MAEERLAEAFAAIDAANADDPVRIRVRGLERPKELAHAELVSEWIERLCPEASVALLLAGRAHHLRRWELPRSGHPEGRAGYLQWRRALQDHHAREARQILEDLGYAEPVIARVDDLLHKRGLARGDAEVQTLEDALCLVFLETQFRELAEKLDGDKLLEVTRKTLKKMSPRAIEVASGMPLDARDLETIRLAATA